MTVKPSSHESSTSSAPMLNYSEPKPQSRLPEIAFSSIVFVIAHLSAEFVTGYILLFKFFVLGMPANPHQWEKLQGRFISDMFTEAAWIVVAALVVFSFQWLPRRQTSLRPRRSYVLATIAGPVYCWARWALWGLSRSIPFPYPEDEDFLISMVLAAVVGLVLGVARRDMRVG